MTITVGALAISAVAIVVGSVLQRVSGLGVGLVVGPVLVLLYGPVTGIIITNLTTTISGAMLTWVTRKHIDWKRYWGLIAAAMLGVVPGALLVRELPGPVLSVVVGAIVLLSVAFTAVTPRLPETHSPVGFVAAGAVGGLFNVTAGVAGPALVVYSRLSRWDHLSFAATVQPVFMTLGFVSIAVKHWVGATASAGLPPWWFFCAAAAFVLLGIFTGGRIARRVPMHRARTLALVVAGAGSAAALIRGVLALVG